ncbi:MAG: hypothetical protein GY816_10940, partial [Cytophagales bacterium]|nr:hypothetical protein [Cytophagales bacterium]
TVKTQDVQEEYIVAGDPVKTQGAQEKEIIGPNFKFPVHSPADTAHIECPAHNDVIRLDIKGQSVLITEAPHKSDQDTCDYARMKYWIPKRINLQEYISMHDMRQLIKKPSGSNTMNLWSVPNTMNFQECFPPEVQRHCIPAVHHENAVVTKPDSDNELDTPIHEIESPTTEKTLYPECDATKQSSPHKRSTWPSHGVTINELWHPIELNNEQHQVKKTMKIVKKMSLYYVPKGMNLQEYAETKDYNMIVQLPLKSEKNELWAINQHVQLRKILPREMRKRCVPATWDDVNVAIPLTEEREDNVFNTLGTIPGTSPDIGRSSFTPNPPLDPEPIGDHVSISDQSI